MHLNDPVHQRHVLIGGGDPPPAPADRFRPAPLSSPVIDILQRAMERSQDRRTVFHAGPLRVCLDGKELRQWDPRFGACGPLHVPLSASYLEIFGEDADGALLLAVFPLSEPGGVWDDSVQQMSVTLEGGQTVALGIALLEETGGEECEYVIQMTYTGPTARAEV